MTLKRNPTEEGAPRQGSSCVGIGGLQHGLSLPRSCRAVNAVGKKKPRRETGLGRVVGVTPSFVARAELNGQATGGSDVR
jgi:hypothetical protein